MYYWFFSLSSFQREKEKLKQIETLKPEEKLDENKEETNKLDLTQIIYIIKIFIIKILQKIQMKILN